MILGAIGALLCLTSVFLDAGTSHVISEEQAKTWMSLGIRYQFFHGLALIVISVFLFVESHEKTRKLVYIASILFLTGILFFSGSLYLLALWGFRPVPMITPTGGLLLIAGWTMLAYTFFRRNVKER